jgi:hypothetical protein
LMSLRMVSAHSASILQMTMILTHTIDIITSFALQSNILDQSHQLIHWQHEWSNRFYDYHGKSRNHLEVISKFTNNLLRWNAICFLSF